MVHDKKRAGATAPVPPKRKIAVLGTSISTIEQAPVHDPEWEIWACSPWMQNRMFPRSEDVAGFDAFFEIHWGNQFYSGEQEQFIPWLAKCGKPVYVFEDIGKHALPHPVEMPNQVLYPKSAMEAQHGTAFFTSTIAWMLALAIDRRPTDIGVWGVDMAGDSEYGHQKFGCLHFLSLARLLGIHVHLPKASELLVVARPYPDRYATETAKALQNKLDTAQAELAKLDQDLSNTDNHRRSLENAICTRRGEIEVLRSLQRVLV